MILYINERKYHYELENLLKLFFPNERITVIEDICNINNDENYIVAVQENNNGNYLLKTKFKYNTKTFTDEKQETNIDDCELRFAQMIYNILTDCTGSKPLWGVLTGVRPIKLINNLIDEMGKESATKYLKEELLVDDTKLNLALQTHHNQIDIIKSSTKRSFSLYVSIPFCKTRCAYCSFVSQSIESAFKLIPQYVDLLCKEIEYTSRIAKQQGLKLETVYIGGGTPTTLTPKQLAQVMETINNNFDMSTCREFTVEAGRPDTIDKAKLLAIKENGATRISINPQTMNDEVLEAIGRKHTAVETIEAYNLAKQLEFNNINMDLIAGLPKDNLESFQNSVNTLIDLKPQNITIHTLAMKKSSRLNQEGMLYKTDKELLAKRMLDFANKTLVLNEFLPYYLYRQSKIIANLENTSYCKAGYEGIYNIFIMDETHSILACGAGGVTKFKNPYTNKLVRISNYKFPYEYNNQFEEILKRKEQVISYYDKIKK